MSVGKEKLVIINRSFWPVYPVIGEALMRLAENQTDNYDVSVIMQDHANIQSKLLEHHRGDKVKFFPCKAFSFSGSGVLRRIIDAIFFMLWVFITLLWVRPKKIYVSTDPPVLVPFIVLLYSKISGAKYLYHLQDIHPEAANVVIPVNPFVYKIMQWIDCVVMKHAALIITITDEMADEIHKRSSTKAEVVILANPAVSFEDVALPEIKTKGFTFCGNAGRLQHIPLLVNSIEKYHLQGGTLPFVFAGGGLFSSELKRLSENSKLVSYLGVISAKDAAELSANYEWALLPIKDEVTRFAFPSKSSSYVFSGALVAAICGKDTSVASWVVDNKLGVVIKPDIISLCDFFKRVENNTVSTTYFDTERAKLKKKLDINFFVERLENLVNRV
ncbi:glycosyltransferase [Marinomonas primoryensis]|uniref:Glycosyltransferase n=1 Tax=Marinomonas primoryensis TaxID=178399 RepID=A0A2Z4PXD6_9GAMM|nr:glycosyltransferase [Marinomonas primoryensis]AWY01052.1 glycosyltransferase [Marinomonas primoryensis]AWY02107.1 glycosyltransferase [Marinomonas primoryensis]